MANIQIQNNDGSWEELFAIKGSTGATPNIQVVAETLPPGSDATVKKSGTAENPTFTIGVPRGDKGENADNVITAVDGVYPNEHGHISLSTIYATTDDLANAVTTSHASDTTVYGIGTGSLYGHVKLSDSISSSSAASAGIAATPKAVKTAYDLAKSAVKTVNGNKPDSTGNIVIDVNAGNTVHIGDDAPTNEDVGLWVDLDEPIGLAVSSVNGTGPDASGNVQLTLSGDVTGSLTGSKIKTNSELKWTIGGETIGVQVRRSGNTGEEDFSVVTYNDPSFGSSATKTFHTVVRKDGAFLPSHATTLSASDATLTLKNKSGETLNQVTVNNVAKATSADSATKATQDGSGNVITSTYATKSEVTAVSNVANAALPKASITYSTTDLTAGTSALTTGSIYLVYE